MTELPLRERMRSTQRSPQQSSRHAWNRLHSFGVHSHGRCIPRRRAVRAERSIRLTRQQPRGAGDYGVMIRDCGLLASTNRRRSS